MRSGREACDFPPFITRWHAEHQRAQPLQFGRAKKKIYRIHYSTKFFEGKACIQRKRNGKRKRRRSGKRKKKGSGDLVRAFLGLLVDGEEEGQEKEAKAKERTRTHNEVWE